MCTVTFQVMLHNQNSEQQNTLVSKTCIDRNEAEENGKISYRNPDLMSAVTWEQLGAKKYLTCMLKEIHLNCLQTCNSFSETLRNEASTTWSFSLASYHC